MAVQNSKTKPQTERAIVVLVFCVGIGAVGALLYALQAPSPGQIVSILSIALLIQGAALLAGAILGFLFGIPRTLQRGGDLDAPPQENASAATDAPQAISYQVNTNLEQISDWLTKILVGVGLTQLTSLPGALQNFADYVAPGLGGFPSSKVFAVASGVFFLICGFLISYLWTRLYLAGAFRQADLSALGGKLAEVENKVSEIEKQAAIDAKALGIMQRQLNSADTTPITQEELNQAIAPSSPNVKQQIFYQAEDIRRNNWENRQDKPKMERTIPIFKALIASDTNDVYYANHGQLGFALKDKLQPDWAEAAVELTKAITLRGDERVWWMYEFNRAICNINLDEQFKLGQLSSAENKQKIHADLKIAAEDEDLLDLILQNETTKKWLDQNQLMVP